jgi:TorA maturation chaperone TorD
MDLLPEETRTAFYREMAELTRQFIDFDSELINSNLTITTG